MVGEVTGKLKGCGRLRPCYARGDASTLVCGPGVCAVRGVLQAAQAAGAGRGQRSGEGGFLRQGDFRSEGERSSEGGCRDEGG